MNDKVKKGRQQRGITCPLSKLNEQQVIAIRILYQAGISKKDLSTMYKVHCNTITPIINRKTWKHI